MNDMTLPTIRSETIFKIDSKGQLRIWKYEVRGSQWRTISGLADGQQVESGWTICQPKSQETGEAQALFEAEAAKRHKLERTYHRTPDECDTPNFFEPMLAQKYKAVEFPVYSQAKLDGVRCIARAEGLFTRQGKPILSCPHIEEELAEFFAHNPDLILDGELYNHELKADFEQLVSAIRKQKPSEAARDLVQYHVYDCPSINAPFSERISAVTQNCSGEIVIPVETRYALNQEMLDADYEEFLAEGYEGQMVRLDEPYEQKRSKRLLKRKEFVDDEFEISRIIEGNGTWAGYGKVVEILLADGRTAKATVKGTQAFCRTLLEERDRWVGKKVTVQYFALTGDGIPRFPIAIKFHDGEKI
jgi:DNA ligase-1